MPPHDRTTDDRSSSSRVLSELTASLAATMRFDEITDVVCDAVAQLGFGGMWLAVLDEPTGRLMTLKQVIDGVDCTREVPVLSAQDHRLPIGLAFRERRFVNVTDPDQVIPLDGDNDPPHPGKVAMPRGSYDRLRGRPFASGPLVGGRGQPVGALGLTSYQGRRTAVIPDEALAGDVVDGFLHHLGLALERARHLAQLDERLARAQAALEKEARLGAIGTVAGVVAHDLNNLLAQALLATGIGLRSPADAFKVLPGMEKATRRMLDLVGRLQRIARPSRGDLVDVQEVIEDIVLMTMPLARERSIEITTEVPVVPLARCEVVLLHRVVLNLLVNAVDAIGELPAERRRVRISAHHDADVVRIRVADRGPGIAPHILPRLFQPFQTTKQGDHHGLGLAGSQAALEPFGARITARNDPGGGAVFEIVLEDPGVGPPAPRPPTPAPAAARPARELKILVVDDDPDILSFVELYLAPLGYCVATATDADAAIAAATGAAQAEPFDVVLCDLGMPRHNGFELCRLLREAGYVGKLVLMTGFDTLSLTSDQLAAACDAMLKKPFAGAELTHAIEELLAPPPDTGSPPQ